LRREKPSATLQQDVAIGLGPTVIPGGVRARFGAFNTGRAFLSLPEPNRELARFGPEIVSI